jgi:hypothetical protein
MNVSIAAALLVALTGMACSSESPSTSASTQPTLAPATAAKAAAVVTLLEPSDGQFAGHIADFRWSPVEGADGYRMKIATLSGRVVWESPVLTSAEAHLPATVALEPEAHTWQVTALKGADVLATSAAFRFTITP